MPSVKKMLTKLERYSQFTEVTGSITYIEESSGDLPLWYWRKAIRMGLITVVLDSGRSRPGDELKVTASGVCHDEAPNKLLRLFGLKHANDPNAPTIPVIRGAIIGESDPVAFAIEKSLAIQFFDPLEAVVLAQDLSKIYSVWLADAERVINASTVYGWGAVDDSTAARFHRHLEAEFNEIVGAHWSEILASVRSKISD